MNPVKRIVIDTSSLVSAVLRPNSVPRHAFLAAIKDHDLCVCQSTLDELLEVLQRSKFDRYAPLQTRMDFWTLVSDRAQF